MKLQTLCIPFLLVTTAAAAAQMSQQQMEDLRSIPYAAWSSQPADAAKAGVTLDDQRRASPGFNVFTDDKNRAFLMDMRGRVIHTWTFPGGQHCEFARVLPTGEALGVCVDQGLVKLDAASKVEWFYKAPVHHDVEIRSDGGLIVPDWDRSQRYQGREVTFEALDFLSGKGERESRWSVWDHFDEIRKHHPPTSLDTPPAPGSAPSQGAQYYHFNSIQVLPPTSLGRRDARFRAGNWLVSFRNVSMIAVIDHETGHLTWSWGPGVLDFQHAPLMLPSGNILIFDNGTNRGWSAAREVDPETDKTVWLYPQGAKDRFFSKWRGSVQRLRNGDTLICDSENGRAFEVTRSGEKVWEFWSPFFNANGRRRLIYRMYRLSPKDAPFSGTASTTPITRIPPPRGN